MSSGSVLDLAPGVEDATITAGDPRQWSNKRQVPAKIVRRVLLASDPTFDPLGLQIRGAYITGTLDLEHASVPCRIKFDSCVFEKTPRFDHTELPGLDLTGSKLLNGLSMLGTHITSNLILTRIKCSGPVRATNLHVTGELQLGEAKLSNPGGDALILNRANIEGSVSVNGGGSSGKREDGPNKRLIVRGEARMLGVQIAGQLNLNWARFYNPGGDALTLDGADIKGGAFLAGRFAATGTVRMHGVQIAGQLVLRGAKLSNPGGDALTLNRANVLAGVFLDKGVRRFTAIGRVRMHGARVAGELVLRGAKLSNPSGDALILREATIESLILGEELLVTGTLDCSFASIRNLRTGDKKPNQALPELSSAHGWTIGTIHGFLATDCRSAAAWLDTTALSSSRSKAIGGREGVFAAQPWHELARAYSQAGRGDYGNWLRWQAAKKTTRAVPRKSRLLRLLYGATVGYGYRSWFVLIWIIGLWIIVSTLMYIHESALTSATSDASTAPVHSVNANAEGVRVVDATETPDEPPDFQPWLAAVEIAVPAVKNGQAAAWHLPGGQLLWLSLTFSTIKAISWVLAALLLAGATGLLRKD